MRLRDTEETTGTAGTVTSIHRRGPDGTLGDVARPYPITSTGNQYYLMVACYFSKWLECFPIPDQKGTTVARKLVYEIVARYGASRELHSDQGTNFGSKVVLEVCRLFWIHKIRTTPYHPRSDGFIERSFRTLGRCLKAACRETKQEWDELVPLICKQRRCIKNMTTTVQRREYQAGELVLIHDIPWNEAAVPVVRSGTHHQSIGQRTGRRVPETRQAAHSGACGLPGGI